MAKLIVFGSILWLVCNNLAIRFMALFLSMTLHFLGPSIIPIFPVVPDLLPALNGEPFSCKALCSTSWSFL